MSSTRELNNPLIAHHDALKAALRAVSASGKLGQHNGLPATIIVSTTLNDLEAATGKGSTDLVVATVCALPCAVAAGWARRANGGHWQFRLRCCLSTSQFLPQGASWTWPRGGGWGGGASCCGAGAAGASGGAAGASGSGAGASGGGAGAAGCRGGDSGCSARGGGAATDGASGFTVGAGISGGSGVISPRGAGLISAVSIVRCSLDTDRPCP
jgi:hypothetical protein